MKHSIQSAAFSTPGRICLFGEHQDYLGLPVIPCAISLRITLSGSRRTDREVYLDLPDIHSHEVFSLQGVLPYVKERDYFRSTVNVMRKHGYTFSSGFDCLVRGTIPINSGTSSSSALIVTWINFLATMSDQADQLSPDVIARYAHEAEVLEFGEPGGMMDHFSTAIGGVIFLEFSPAVRVETMEPKLGTFVLGDSMEPKDTKSILSRVKDQVIAVSNKLAAVHPGFSLQHTSVEEIKHYASELTAEQRELLIGTLTNRDITMRAKTMLMEKELNHRAIGTLLSEHQKILRDTLKISTPKIDRMLSAATDAGAYGGKINGSGGGGCMFAYAPDDPNAVADAIRSVGGKAYVVRTENGTRRELLESGL